MMTSRKLLLLDGIINLVLGVLLLFFPATWSEWLGVPGADPGFYPSLFGAVLFGIGLALLVERSYEGHGLGLKGAIMINLCVGIALVGWLLMGDLGLERRGLLFLWALVVLLFGISGVELCNLKRVR